MSELREGLLLGIGNPLLDLQAHVEKAFLDKYNLDENAAILADEKHKPLFDELQKTHEVEYIPGGATQNSMRLAQWMIGKPKVAVFFGCVGKDEYGETLAKKAQQAGVDVKYQFTDKEKTGTCAALIYKEHRSLVTDLGAANLFTVEHAKLPEQQKVIETAQFYYISGFFLTVSPETIQLVGEHACKENKTFTMNLSAPFVCQVPVFLQRLKDALPYVDVIFGNETEAEALAQSMEWGVGLSVAEIARNLYSLPKANARRNRLVVLTQGSEPVIVVADGKVTEHPVTKLAKEQLVDTNGAGDSFVGGFLTQYIQGKPLEECLRCGNWAANVVIQRSGCTFPPGPCQYK